MEAVLRLSNAILFPERATIVWMAMTTPGIPCNSILSDQAADLILTTRDRKPFAEIEPGIEKTDPTEGDHQRYVDQTGEIKDAFKDSGKACLV